MQVFEAQQRRGLGKDRRQDIGQITDQNSPRSRRVTDDLTVGEKPLSQLGARAPKVDPAQLVRKVEQHAADCFGVAWKNGRRNDPSVRTDRRSDFADHSGFTNTGLTGDQEQVASTLAGGRPAPCGERHLGIPSDQSAPDAAVGHVLVVGHRHRPSSHGLLRRGRIASRRV